MITKYPDEGEVGVAVAWTLGFLGSDKIKSVYCIT